VNNKTSAKLDTTA